MPKPKAFQYEIQNGKVSVIQGTDVSAFLRIGELPTRVDRSLTEEALRTVAGF